MVVLGMVGRGVGWLWGHGVHGELLDLAQAWGQCGRGSRHATTADVPSASCGALDNFTSSLDRLDGMLVY